MNPKGLFRLDDINIFTYMLWLINLTSLTKSVKVHRKDQSVERNASFYYFGQFRVFLLYFG